MSLKTFHLIFITAASALALGFAVWSFKDYLSAGGTPMQLVMAIGSAITAVGLIAYERYFLKKTKNVGYL